MNTQDSAPSSRRRFLANAGLGLAAAATLRRATAQGSTANSRIRIGLIGCGSRGALILNLLQENGGYEVAGAADYFADRVKVGAERAKLPPERTFTGLQCAEKMIAAGGLDAVAIISPPYFHPSQARAAVNAGLNVYLAKPVAVDVPGCHSISESAAIAQRKGRVFLVDFQTRANEFFIEAMRRVHAGAIGPICLGESYYHAERLKAKAKPGETAHETRLRNWVFDQTLSGDIIVEQNIHTLDVMSWAMREQPPVRCSGTGGRRVRVDVGNAWDYFALTFEYANDVGVAFSSRQFDAQGEPGGIINKMFGPGGVLLTKYGGDVMIRAGKDNFYRGGATTAIYKEGIIANLKTFHAAVSAGDATNPTVVPSVTSNLVAILGRTAAYEKRIVTWAEVIGSKRKLDANLGGLVA